MPDFKEVIFQLGLGDLAEVAGELNWIPSHLVNEGWRTALSESYLEIAKERLPNKSKTARSESAYSLEVNAGYSLLLLLNSMRNRLHPSRWLKEKAKLESEEAFIAWSHAVMLASGEIRDCLFVRFQADIGTYVSALLKSRMRHEC